MRTPAVWSSYMNAGSGPASVKEETAVSGLDTTMGERQAVDRHPGLEVTWK